LGVIIYNKEINNLLNYHLKWFNRKSNFWICCWNKIICRYSNRKFWFYLFYLTYLFL
jgi:hypothetical protein